MITKGLVAALPALTTALGNFFNSGLASLDDVFDSNNNMGQKIMRWLGFDQNQGDEIFSGIKQGLTDLKTVFIGDGENGLISRMLKNLKSVFIGAGKEIANSLYENRHGFMKIIIDRII